MSPEADAERVCAYLIERVRRVAGARWAQGRHRPPLGAPNAGPALDVMATQRLWKVPAHVAEGLVAWSHGQRRVAVLDQVPTPAHVLALQAEGRRCVSLLVNELPEKGLDFALHDLCHLEKFADPAHHVEQVGFFVRMHAAMAKEGWQALDRRYDEAWAKDVEHVASDMNGSSIFLFAALKMKLKMAERRALARELGTEAPTGGPLSEAEQRAFDRSLAILLDLLELSGEARSAALGVSTKRDLPDAAVVLQAWFASQAPAERRMLAG